MRLGKQSAVFGSDPPPFIFIFPHVYFPLSSLYRPSLMILHQTVKETLEWLTQLPICMQTRSGADSVELGTGSLSPSRPEIPFPSS